MKLLDLLFRRPPARYSVRILGTDLILSLHEDALDTPRTRGWLRAIARAVTPVVFATCTRLEADGTDLAALPDCPKGCPAPCIDPTKPCPDGEERDHA